MYKNFVTLQVGNWYQSRDGQIIKIVKCLTSGVLFQGNNSLSYKYNGTYDVSGMDDLVLHIEEPVIVPKKALVPKGRVIYTCGNHVDVTSLDYTEREFANECPDYTFVRFLEYHPEFPITMVPES